MYFKTYGHVCDLEPLPDILTQYIPGNDRWAKFRRGFKKLFMLSYRIVRNNFSSIKACEEEQKLYCQHIFVIHPLSLFRLYWNCLMVLVNVFLLMYFPYSYAFMWHQGKSYPFRPFAIIVNVINIIFYVDIIINLRTAFYDKNRQINLKSRAMFLNYLPYLIVDLVSSIPYVLNPKGIMATNSTVVAGLDLTLALLKILRLVNLLRYVTYLMKILKSPHYVMLIVQMIITVIVYSLWVGCITMLLGFISVELHIFDEPQALSWLTDHDVWNTTRTLIFTSALFRVLCIYSNADSATIKYQAHTDIIALCVIWICSKLLYILFISVMLIVQRSVSSSKAKYKEMILQLKQFMEHNQLSTYTQNRLIQYYEFKYQKTFFREQEILSLISGQLRQEILILKCKEMVENVHIFQGLPQSILLHFIALLQLEIFLSGDTVIESNTPGTSMYFISSGTISVYSASGKEIYHLEDGSYFGEIELVMANKLRIASYVAIEPCELYRLERKDFMRAIKPYPELLQRMEDKAAERDQHISTLDEKHKEYLSQQRGNKKKNY